MSKLKKCNLLNLEDLLIILREAKITDLYDMEFVVEKKGNILFIVLPPLNSQDDGKKIATQMKQWLLSDCDVYLFNFEKVNFINQGVSREFSLFQQTLKKNLRYMYAINMNSALINELKQKGIHEVFNPVSDLNNVIQKAKVLSQEK